MRFVEQAIPFKRDKWISRKLAVFPVLIYTVVVETGQVCTDGHLREENSDGIFHVRNAFRTNMRIFVS